MNLYIFFDIIESFGNIYMLSKNHQITLYAVQFSLKCFLSL